MPNIMHSAGHRLLGFMRGGSCWCQLWHACTPDALSVAATMQRRSTCRPSRVQLLGQCKCSAH